MKCFARLLPVLIGVALWAEPEDPADLYQEPRFEVSAGLALGSDNRDGTVLGPTVLGVAYLSDHWGLEGWAVPVGLMIVPLEDPALEAELGPETSAYRQWGAGLVSRWRLDFVSPSILNVLLSAGWHRVSLDGVSGADRGGSWYGSAGAQLILGRPFVLGARLRWFPVGPGGGRLARPDRWMVLGSGTLGLAF